MKAEKLPSDGVSPFQPCDICPVEEICVPERRCRHTSCAKAKPRVASLALRSRARRQAEICEARPG